MRQLLLLSLLMLATIAVYTQDKDEDYFDTDFFKFKRKPFISATFGTTISGHKNLSQKLQDDGIFDFQLGFFQIKEHKPGILNYKSDYVFGGRISSDLRGKLDNGTIRTEIWRAGAGKQKGFGYDLGGFKLILSTGKDLGANRMVLKSSPILLADSVILDNYRDNFCFANSALVGIKIVPLENFAIDAGYERQIVFQKTMFWYWAGSYVAEEIGNFFIEEFVREIFKSSPKLGPVFNFLLKGAYSFGAMELRKDKMNFPFDTEPGLIHDSYRFGVTFLF